MRRVASFASRCVVALRRCVALRCCAASFALLCCVVCVVCVVALRRLRRALRRALRCCAASLVMVAWLEAHGGSRSRLEARTMSLKPRIEPRAASREP